MNRPLSEAQFQKAIIGLNVSQQTLDIAHAVLVEGRQQSEFVESLGITKGAVSQAVSRVYKSHLANSIPPGFELVTAILPKRLAFTVKQWAKKYAQGRWTK